MHHYFETYGAGEPLILLHGNGEDCTYFKHQIPAFAKYYKVYAIDTRGHGKTPRGDGEFSIRRFAEDLYDFFEWQKIPKAHILGFSDGANIAMYFALAHPERINKLILNGGNIFPTGLKAYFNVPCQVGYRLLKPIPLKNEKVHHFYELLKLMALEPHITPAQLHTITVPTMVLAGSHDIVKFSHSRLMAKSISQCKFKILEGGHMVSSTDPQGYNEAVFRFLKNSYEKY